MLIFVRLFLIIFAISFVLGCSDLKTESAAPKPVHVTNAEQALRGLVTDGTSAVVFHVKPIRSTACEYMYIEFGQQSSDGEWDYRTHSISPGQDDRETFGQQDLKDQLHFAEVLKPGEYGVLALGCKPYGADRMKRIKRGFSGTFNIEKGKLNYIGELSLIPRGYASFDVDVENRSGFASGQIGLRMPGLSTFFHESIVEKTSTQLSPKQKARKDEIHANLNRFQTLVETRNKVVKEHDKARAEYKSWKAKHSYVRVNAPDEVKIEHNNILMKADYLAKKVALYERFIIEKRSDAYISEYIRLYDNLENHYRAFYKKFPLKYPDFSPAKVGGELKSKQVRIIDNVAEARLKLEEFEESNP